MPDLLLELFCEEIPAHMQRQAADDLKSKITNALVELNLTYEGAVAHVTPRRLCLHIAGLAAKSADIVEQKKGPKVGAPDAAVQGFLKSTGLSSIDQAQIQSDPKKGDFYIAHIERAGRDTKLILSEIITKTVRDFPWPKSMRWGAASLQGASLRWVRPLHSIIATFGTDTETPDIIDINIDGIVAGDITHGHRFMSSKPVQARRFDDYVAQLEQNFVILDFERRKDFIRNDAKTLAFAQGLEVVEDEGLLNEVAGLVEWPVVLMGEFDKSFLDVPAPVIRTTIRANQKCFVLRDAKSALTNKFLIVANIKASDGGTEIIRGNERVVAARLSDAKFFFDQDKKTALLERAKKLETITFHEKLGTQTERVARIAALARVIAPLVGADADKAELAAKLAKADLVTEMVGEFPELQGFMGKTYALAEGVDADVAAAIEDHYKPVGPSDSVPTNPVSIAVALADKLDMLTGFWAIDEKPTGSKDPFALRRAALGVIKLITVNNLKLDIISFLQISVIYNKLSLRSKHAFKIYNQSLAEQNSDKTDYQKLDEDLNDEIRKIKDYFESDQKVIASNLLEETISLLDFFHDRLRGQLREQGLRHDVIDAVLALEGQDDLLIIVRRAEALDAFLKTDNGKALQAGVTRAFNILKIEEKKDGAAYNGNDAALLSLPEETALHEAITSAKADIETALQKDGFTAAMTALAGLRAPIDSFFDKIMVNEEPHRAARLGLLARIRALTSQIADFSKLEG